MRDAIKPSLPSGYTVNKGQTSDNLFDYKISNDKGEEGSDRVIYNFMPSVDSFSEINLMMATELYKWEGMGGIVTGWQ